MLHNLVDNEIEQKDSKRFEFQIFDKKIVKNTRSLLKFQFLPNFSCLLGKHL